VFERSAGAVEGMGKAMLLAARETQTTVAYSHTLPGDWGLFYVGPFSI
jgi:hypothetical protein